MSKSSHTDSTVTPGPPTAPTVAAMLPPELVTVLDVLRWATSRFTEADLVFGHGTSTAVDEAAYLILSTLHLPIDRIEPWLDARLTAPERDALADIVSRRIATRKPAPYLTGTAWIQGHRFRVDERVIVPRSYLGELLTTGALSAVLPHEPARVLDLCTGSGCLAILAALTWQDATVDATDNAAAALEVARANIADYGLSDRIALHEGDLLTPLGHRRFDLILANPPYVAAAEIAAFPPEYAAEPVSAHAGGDDGLDIVRRILAEVPRRLTADGLLVMEIGTGREPLEAAYPHLAFIWLDTEESEGEVLCLSARDFAAT